MLRNVVVGFFFSPWLHYRVSMSRKRAAAHGNSDFVIRRGACSAEGNLETLEALAGRGRRGFCRISVSYFGILVRIFKHRVRTVFSFPNACREVDVTRQQTKTNFQTWLWPLSAFKSDPRPFVADLYPLETFLWKRNSNPCSEGFKISVEEIGIQISWKSSLLLPSTAKPF